MTCHLINKAVMKQNCIGALNQHAQPLKKKAAFSNFTITRPFNGPLSGTTRVSQYQKGETNLDFTEARDSE